MVRVQCSVCPDDTASQGSRYSYSASTPILSWHLTCTNPSPSRSFSNLCSLWNSADRHYTLSTALIFVRKIPRHDRTFLFANSGLLSRWVATVASLTPQPFHLHTSSSTHSALNSPSDHETAQSRKDKQDTARAVSAIRTTKKQTSSSLRCQAQAEHRTNDRTDSLPVGLRLPSHVTRHSRGY